MYIYNIYIYITYIYIYYINHIYVFTNDRFFEVAIENWPEWDLNERSLKSVQMF